jgi:hypothetical protein
MTRPPIVRITTALVALGVLAVAMFAAFYIIGALAAVVVCAVLGVGLIALVVFASTKLTHYRDRRDVGGPLEPAHPPVADPPG